MTGDCAPSAPGASQGTPALATGRLAHGHQVPRAIPSRAAALLLGQGGDSEDQESQLVGFKRRMTAASAQPAKAGTAT